MMNENIPRWHFLRRLQRRWADWRAAPRPRFSLQWRMIQMILVCWVLPVIVLILVGGTMLYQSITDQAIERLSLSVQSAYELTTMRLESAITQSRALTYKGTLRDAWTQYAQDDDVISLYATTRDVLAEQYQTDEMFVSTIVLFEGFEDDPIYQINETITDNTDVRQDIDDVFAQAIAMSETLGTDIGFVGVGNRLFLMRNLVDKNYDTFAIFLLELNTDVFFVEFSQIANCKVAAVVVNDWVIDLTLENPPAATLAPLGQEVLGIDGAGEQGLIITYQSQMMRTALRLTAEEYSFAYYAIGYPSILYEQWNMTVVMLLIIFLLMLPLAWLIFVFFHAHVTKPIEAIIALAGEIGREKYGVQLPDYALESDEFGLLGENFNKMSLTLQQQFEHIYKEELALRDARIMALQSQINPHFLNNTLEIINWEARMQGDLKVCNMLESLATMLNAAMDRRNRPMVHLSEELMYVDAYLYIINERLGKRLTFVKDIPDDCLDYQVPRLILQPILENAVNHGINPLQKGTICLRARKENDWLVLAVENDGQLSEKDRARIELVLRADYTPESLSSGSLGLRNVHQRLRILYGEESGILVDITKKDVTSFELKVKIGEV